MTDPLDDLRARFGYRAETADRWTLLDAPKGVLQGDCEDWSYTAAWLLSGRSWLTFWWKVCTCQIVFWRAISGGQTHMMLWVRGRGWIDNIYPQFGPRRHRRIFPLWGPFLAATLLLK